MNQIIPPFYFPLCFSFNSKQDMHNIHVLCIGIGFFTYLFG